MMRHNLLNAIKLVLAALALIASPVYAGSGGSGSDPTVEESEEETVINYCLNISDKVAEVRLARQTQALKALESRLDEKTRKLEQRQEELKQWIRQRNELQNAAEAGLVSIYATMDPEAAAKQMANLDLR